MLSKSAILAVRDIVHNGLYGSRTLILRPGAFIGSMVRASALPANHPVFAGDNESVVVGNEGELTELEAMLFEFSKKSSSGMGDQHENEMEAVVNEVTRRVSASLDFASNVVNPIIRDLSREVNELRDHYVGDAFEENSLELLHILPIYESEALKNIYANHTMYGEDKGLGANAVAMITKDLTTDAVIATCKTGLSELDGKIDNFIRTHLPNTVSGIGYQIKEMLNTNCVYGPGNMNPFKNHVALVSYLYINGVLSGRKADIDVDEFDGAFRNMLATRRNYFAKCLDNQSAAMQRAFAPGTIAVHGYSVPEHNIYAVNSKVYRAWLKDNEQASAGAYLAFVKSGSKDEALLHNNVEAYVKQWEGISKTLQRTNEVRADNETNQLIHRYLSEVISSEDSIDDSKKAELQTKLNQRIKNKRYYSALDLDEYLLGHVCSIMGQGTDVYEILTIMKAEMARDENLSPKGAAALAAIQLMVNWAAEQMQWENF